MTVSSTPCCKKQLPDARVLRRSGALLCALLLWCCSLLLPAAAHAQASAQDAPSISGLRLEGGEAGLYLSAALHFELPPLVEDALFKGIPMSFVLEAEVARERWYWYDRRMAQAVRHLRLSYQPLTRRWRLQVSTTPFENTGLGVALAQNYDTLAEALESMQRVARWKIADSAVVEVGDAYNVQLAFRLDMSQLPRPFQISALGRNGWSLALERRQRLTVEPAP